MLVQAQTGGRVRNTLNVVPNKADVVFAWLGAHQARDHSLDHRRALGRDLITIGRQSHSSPPLSPIASGRRAAALPHSTSDWLSVQSLLGRARDHAAPTPCSPWRESNSLW